MSIGQRALGELVANLRSSNVYTPDTPGYEEKLVRWSDTAERRAGVVVCPIDAEDISTAVIWSQNHAVDLAVRGGGHSATGKSSSEGGLVIDLCRMNKVAVDTKHRIAIVQGGCVWKDVDDALGQHGLAAIGGTVNHTGVGGLTLGGGYGHLVGMYGLAVDNLLGAKMVLGNGMIVDTNESSHPDLFWAIRGAGHNFGVVVEFTFRAHVQKNQVFAGTLIFEPEKLDRVMAVLNIVREAEGGRASSAAIFAQPPAFDRVMVSTLIFFNGTEREARTHFERLFALAPIADDTCMIPYSVLNSLHNPMCTFGKRQCFKGGVFIPPFDPEFVRECYEVVRARVQDDPELQGSGLIWENYDTRNIRSVPVEKMAFAGRTQEMNALIMLRWTDPRRDQELNDWVLGLQDRFLRKLQHHYSSASRAPSNQPKNYINYLEPGITDTDNVYGENLPRLQRIKAAYDPEEVFSKMGPISPIGSYSRPMPRS